MSSLAEQALEHARLRLAGKLPKTPTPVAPKIDIPADASAKSMNLVITGPTNQFMFLEGRNWAIDLVAALRATPAPVVIERLMGAAVGRPGSYAAGIKSVIKDLQEAGNA